MEGTTYTNFIYDKNEIAKERRVKRWSLTHNPGTK